MIFRQLFEPQSSAYTYLVACEAERQAVLIDPVLETVERDLQLLGELGLALKYTLETHIHADHVTGAARLRDATGCQVRRAGGKPRGSCRPGRARRSADRGRETVRCSRSTRPATPTTIIAIWWKRPRARAFSPATR